MGITPKYKIMATTLKNVRTKTAFQFFGNNCSLTIKAKVNPYLKKVGTRKGSFHCIGKYKLLINISKVNLDRMKSKFSNIDIVK